MVGAVRLSVHLPNGTLRQIEMLSVSVKVFDIFRSELQSLFGRFERIEYEDEDGDRIAVRGDEQLAAMAAEPQPLSIYLIAKEQCELTLPTILPEDLRHLKVIAHGQFGTVYRSLWTSRDQIVAVKSVALRDEAESRDDVLNELRVLGKCCRSEFIVELISTLVHGSMLSIVLEYMDRGSVAIGVLGPVVRSILEGVAFLSEQSIMHRDLKPDNYVVNSSGRVKLADFGLMEGSVADSVVGTGAYMAPERVHEIWSLGVSFLEMATARHPFLMPDEDADVAPQIFISRIISEQCMVPEYLQTDHGSEFSNMVTACVQREASTRPSLNALKNCDYMLAAWPIDHISVANYVELKYSS